MRDAIRVPTKFYKHFDGHIYNVIEFQSYGSPRQGVRLHEILSNPGLVANGNESVLRGYGSIRLWLTWPGYGSIQTYAVIDCAQMSKARLALEVCRSTAAFLQKCASVPITSSNAEYRIGPGGFSAANVTLLSIANVGEGYWQADLEVDIN